MTSLSTLNRSDFQYHPYHLVTQSPWPLLISISLFSFVIGAVLYMHGYSYPLVGTTFRLGFINTAATMYFWLTDVTNEGTLNGDHTKEVVKGLLIGFLLFLVSELFVFVSVFWAYFHSSLVAAIEIGGIWPPLAIIALDPYGIPLLNTIVLLSSGSTVTMGHHAVLKGDRRYSIWGLLLTIVLAIFFTGLQYFEYVNAPFTIADSVFGSVFYCSTGLHGLHVLVGTGMLLSAFIRLVNYHFTDSHHQGLESGILYWHFVDVVWLFLYVAVYYWGGL